MSGVVTFNEAAFLLRYPQFVAFATANPGALQERFNEVTAIYINNTLTSIVTDVTERTYLINYAIAHMLAIEGATATGGQGSTSGTVGRVSSATEGSVSATLDMGAVSGSEAWWLQSQYGATYWNATAKYRTFRYGRAPAPFRRSNRF